MSTQFNRGFGYSFYMHHEGEPFLRDNGGYIVRKSEFRDMVNQVIDFYKEHNDDDIQDLNSEIERLKRIEYEMETNRTRPKKKPKHSNGYVYFAKNEDGKIKIGRTTNLESRMKSLNTSSPHTIDLVSYIKTDSCVSLEEFAHEYFAIDNIKGEWFDINKKDMELFAQDLELEIVFAEEVDV